MKPWLLVIAMGCGAKEAAEAPVVASPTPTPAQVPLPAITIDAAPCIDAPVAMTPDPPDAFQVIAAAFGDTGLPNTPAVSADHKRAVHCSANGSGMASWFTMDCQVLEAGGKPQVITVIDGPGAQKFYERDPKITAAVIAAAHAVTARLGAGSLPMAEACMIRPLDAAPCEAAGTKWSIADDGTVKAGAHTLRFTRPKAPSRSCGYSVMNAQVWVDEVGKLALVDLQWANRSDACGIDRVDEVRRVPL